MANSAAENAPCPPGRLSTPTGRAECQVSGPEPAPAHPAVLAVLTIRPDGLVPVRRYVAGEG